VSACAASSLLARHQGAEQPPIKRILVTGLREAHAARPEDNGLAETAELADPSRFIKLLAGRLEKTL
jgi:molecular chaperone HtpG